MKKTISFLLKGKAFLFGLMMTGGLLFLCSGDASAQAIAGSSVNPDAFMAEKLNVAAYPLGTFDRENTLNVLNDIMSSLKAPLHNGGGTDYQKLKYAYCSAVHTDIAGQFIAPEIALLTNLGGLNGKESKIGADGNQLVALYNDIVSQLD